MFHTSPPSHYNQYCYTTTQHRTLRQASRRQRDQAEKDTAVYDVVHQSQSKRRAHAKSRSLRVHVGWPIANVLPFDYCDRSPNAIIFSSANNHNRHKIGIGFLQERMSAGRALCM